MFKYCLIILLVFFAPSQSYLEVYIPECARQIIPKDIKYTLANFGYIPYGETIVGSIFTPKNQNNQELCTIDNETKIVAQNSKSIMLIKRGGCKFTQKVLQAQKLGANFVIVYDNQTTNLPHVIMKNDGHGHLINIPSIFISSTDGQNLLKALETCNQDVYLKISFDVFQSEIVDLALWLNLNNRQSYVLLRDFYQNDYFGVIEKYVNISPRFRVQYGCQGLLCEKNDCLGQGVNEYCVPVQKFSSQQVTGKTLLMESLRMYFLFYSLPANNKQTWFKYMIKFDENICLQVKDTEYCSFDTMKQVGISSTITQQIKKNITDTIQQLQSDQLNMENVFYKVFKEADEKNVIFYPEAVINGKNFYGLFKAPQVFEMICSSLLKQPKECYSFIKNKNSTQVVNGTDDLWMTVLFIILLMTLGFLVALVVYTRLIKRQVNQQMSMEVNKMVENYVSLTDQKSGVSQKSGSFNKMDV